MIYDATADGNDAKQILEGMFNITERIFRHMSYKIKHQTVRYKFAIAGNGYCVHTKRTPCDISKPFNNGKWYELDEQFEQTFLNELRPKLIEDALQIGGLGNNANNMEDLEDDFVESKKPQGGTKKVEKVVISFLNSPPDTKLEREKKISYVEVGPRSFQDYKGHEDFHVDANFAGVGTGDKQAVELVELFCTESTDRREGKFTIEGAKSTYYYYPLVSGYFRWYIRGYYMNTGDYQMIKEKTGLQFTFNGDPFETDYRGDFKACMKLAFCENPWPSALEKSHEKTIWTRVYDHLGCGNELYQLVPKLFRSKRLRSTKTLCKFHPGPRFSDNSEENTPAEWKKTYQKLIGSHSKTIDKFEELQKDKTFTSKEVIYRPKGYTYLIRRV